MIFRTRNRAVNLHKWQKICIDFNENNVNLDPNQIVTLERVHNGGNSSNQTYKLLCVLFDEFVSFKGIVSRDGG
jgi:hypothetical protein